ncbi:hypothetical protein LCGC14_0129120 [marine sediment metagenome]|uniref:Uncharacterized protein n=1 Tax=marine sediment metagenome TaxID=412755 RepID=A0A0F9V4G9_9ZZZZ|nr:hypothetical protein [Maribacter sp.]HDZ06118.1 hypothetical protein [Maribacter sp.]HEA80830.1 hypothetical protein [Maribacter sp.]
MKEKNVFKKIGFPLLDVPRDLKQKVLVDVENAKLLMDLANLFSSNFNFTANHIFKEVKKINNRKPWKL